MRRKIGWLSLQVMIISFAMSSSGWGFLVSPSHLNIEVSALPELKLAPGFSLTSLDGKVIKLSDFREKTVIINFWATWCPPCRALIRHFINLHKKNKDKGFQMLGVVLDKDKGLVKDFARDYDVNYPLLIPDEKILKDYGPIDSIPMTFFISSEGHIYGKYIGYRPEFILESTLKTLGQEREFSFYLANPQERDDIRVRIYAEDFFLRRDGSIEFLRLGGLKYSYAKSIKFEDTEVVLKAGEKKRVYGTIKVPQDASGGRYALLMVELLPPAESETTEVRSGIRFSVLVSALINPGELERNLKIVGFKVLDQEKKEEAAVGENQKELQFTVSVENTGNVHMMASGTITVRNEAGTVEAIVPLLAGGGYIFPECIRDFKGAIPESLRDGEYTAEAKIRYDEEKSAKAEIGFTLENNRLTYPVSLAE